MTSSPQPPSGAAVVASPWPLHARQWTLLGAPLRPSPEDVAVALELVKERHAPEAGPRALLLGVTPEIATMPWPAATTLRAVDRCGGMIAAVLPSSGVPTDTAAICADWRAMPFDAQSFDLIVGDGCYSNLAFPEEYRALSAECGRVLADDGRMVMRFFASPAEREHTARVADDLFAGRIGSFHAFKWRLAMALQPSAEAGVRLDDIWTAWREICPDPGALAAALDWDPAVIGTIEVYRGSDVRYTFPTLREVRGVLEQHFAEVAQHTPGYELGERCPTLVLRPYRA